MRIPRCCASWLTLTSRNLARRPPQRLISLDDTDDGRQLSLIWRTFKAPDQIVGSFHERRVHGIGDIGEMLNRAGRFLEDGFEPAGVARITVDPTGPV